MGISNKVLILLVPENLCEVMHRRWYKGESYRAIYMSVEFSFLGIILEKRKHVKYIDRTGEGVLFCPYLYL